MDSFFTSNLLVALVCKTKKKAVLQKSSKSACVKTKELHLYYVCFGLLIFPAYNQRVTQLACLKKCMCD